MSDTSSFHDPLSDPSALWRAPAVGGAQQILSTPRQGWVWKAMDPPERRARMRELANWVAWLTTAHELNSIIPACWYRHPKVLEHLTALYAGWVRTYCQDEDNGRDLAEAEWLSMLHTMEPYLKVPACATRHVPPPTPGPEREGHEREERAQALEEFLLTSTFGTGPAEHPVEPPL